MKKRIVFRISPLVRENLRVSLTAVKTNRLRSVLTILMIAVGIMALVGILTAIDAIKGSVTDSFNSMGANTITISSKYVMVEASEQHRRVRNTSTITYRQAHDFAQEYPINALVSIYTTAAQLKTVKYENEQTNPEVTIMGVDANYATVSGLELQKGRFIASSVSGGGFEAVLGGGLQVLFGKTDPIGEFINVEGRRYRVVGVLKPRGTEMGGGANMQVFIPVSNARAVYGGENMNFEIKIQPLEEVSGDLAASEAEITFRSVRRLTPTDQTDFELERSDQLLADSMKTMRYVTIVAFIVGAITLLGAAVGLMNIMLVSVNERTREIGARKAMGATSRIIKQQFLFEAIVIGQLGGLFGMVLGILAGNLTSLAMKTSFHIPWLWMILAVALCFLVGILSGYIPAVRASHLDPIEALRHE